jgi:hypothetical protein
MSALVEYVCVRSDHRDMPVSGASTITMRGRRWAFCASADGPHEWLEIEATPIERVASKALRPMPIGS